MYLTFEEYVEWNGTLDPDTFNEYSFDIESIIDYYTFNRLKNQTEYPDKVKQLAFYLLNYLENKAKSLTPGKSMDGSDANPASIASESNDGVSTEYNVLTAASRLAILEAEAKKAIRRYLYGVKNSLGQALLYRGVYPGE